MLDKCCFVLCFTGCDLLFLTYLAVCGVGGQLVDYLQIFGYISRMKRILLIGNCPLPEEDSKSRPAAGLRTYQFLKPLSEGGYDVRPVMISMPECYDALPGGEGVFSKDDKDLIVKIQAIHDEFHPDAIVAVNTFPSYIASLLDSRVAFWADLNGWIMAEAQAQAHKEGGNEYLGHYFGMEMSILKKADKISAVSKAQEFALLGELAGLGRLNNESFSYPFVEHIPNATELFKGEAGEGVVVGASFPGVPEDAFVLLWMGGYNTWVDEITLFKGVEDAMKSCPNLYFVSTGGGIKGLGEKTFLKFKDMVEGSEFAKRFVFLGWVSTSEIPAIYRAADVGLNVDKICVETLTGARNRINEMMKFGLPVISTLGSEVAGEMALCGAGIGVESGKHEALTAAILEIFHQRHNTHFKQYGEKGMEYTARNNYKAALRPLLRWLENPRPAPDRGVKIRLGGLGFGGLGLPAIWKYLKENGFKKSFAKFRQKVGF